MAQLGGCPTRASLSGIPGVPQPFPAGVLYRPGSVGYLPARLCTGHGKVPPPEGEQVPGDLVSGEQVPGELASGEQVPYRLPNFVQSVLEGIRRFSPCELALPHQRETPSASTDYHRLHSVAASSQIPTSPAVAHADPCRASRPGRAHPLPLPAWLSSPWARRRGDRLSHGRALLQRGPSLRILRQSLCGAVVFMCRHVA